MARTPRKQDTSRTTPTSAPPREQGASRTDGATAAGGRWEKGRSGNPRGRARATAAEINRSLDQWVGTHGRNDAWAGRRSGIGVPGIDKGVDFDFVADRVTDLEAAEMWAGDDVIARVIELPVNERYREGYEWKLDDPDKTKAVTDAVAALHGIPSLVRAGYYERAYGGGAIFPVLNDAQKDLSRPLNEKRITQLRALHVLEPSELDVVSWYTDITDPKYRRPEIYRLNPIAPGGGLSMTGTHIHESRLIVWPGKLVTHRQVNHVRPGWGENVLTLMKAALRGFNLSHTAISTLLVDFAQATIKIKNLASMLAANRIDEIQARMRLLEISRSITQAVLLDESEEYKRETTSVSGLADLIDRVVMRLAAAAGMPVTLMMGQSPKGLGNEGDSDLAWWDKQIAGGQMHDGPRVLRLHELVMLALDGPTKGKVLDSTFRWLPLDQPSEAETATSHFTQAQTDEKYFGMGVLSADDIAESRFGPNGYSYDTKIDWEARAQLQKEQALAEKEAAAAALEAARNPPPPPAAGAPTSAPPQDPAPPDGGTPPAGKTAPKADAPPPGKTITVKEHQRILREATKK